MRSFLSKSKKSIDLQLLLIIGFLLSFGLITLYSASTVESYNNFGDTTRYIIHQIKFGAVIGLLAMFVLYKVDYHIFKKLLPILLASSLILLFLVKFSDLSFSAGGASRWLKLGPFSFQPSELAKITIIVYMAAWLERKKEILHDFWHGLLPSLVVVGLISFLILWQPDFGTMFVIIAIACIMLFAGGLSWKHLTIGFFALFILLYLFIHFEPYRAERLLTFLNPDFDPRGIGYQVNQSLLGIGAGGEWGYGYGLSRQKYNYLPASYTDSIFAVTAEELGFFRVIFVIFGFLALALKGLKISKNSPDMFGHMLAVGLTAWISVQAIVNISALTGLMPLTGIPLPFFSYGSTALISNLAAMGILLNIAKQSK